MFLVETHDLVRWRAVVGVVSLGLEVGDFGDTVIVVIVDRDCGIRSVLVD
jgi:hypothetical protein